MGPCSPIWQETHTLGLLLQECRNHRQGNSKIARPNTLYALRHPSVAPNRCAIEGMTIAPEPIPSIMTLSASPLWRSNQCDTTSMYDIAPETTPKAK